MSRLFFWPVLAVLSLVSTHASGQHSLSVRIEGIESSKGNIQVALYTEKKTFLKMEGMYRAEVVPAVEGSVEAVFEDLPSGAYAVAIFHDENSNQELDKNVMGIPKEPLGFSNARLRTFGPPKFKDCLVRMDSDTSVVIPLE